MATKRSSLSFSPMVSGENWIKNNDCSVYNSTYASIQTYSFQENIVLLAKLFNLGTSKIGWDLLLTMISYAIMDPIAYDLPRFDLLQVSQCRLQAIPWDDGYHSYWHLMFLLMSMSFCSMIKLVAYQCSWLCLTFESLLKLSNSRDVVSCQGMDCAPNTSQCNLDQVLWCSFQRLPWLHDNPVMYPTTLL